jgi:hypothetical protein
MSDQITYSNPRLKAIIPDWPSGSRRVTAVFEIETDAKTHRQRGVRTTTGAPKKLTYARQARIVDGSDGRTYIAELSDYGHATIMKGDMKFEHETIFASDQARHAALMELFAADLREEAVPVFAE